MELGNITKRKTKGGGGGEAGMVILCLLTEVYNPTYEVSFPNASNLVMSLGPTQLAGNSEEKHILNYTIRL